MYEVQSQDKEHGALHWGRHGGWQGGRGWQINTTGAIDPTPSFFIENVLEELDVPGEWFFDEGTHKLYLCWNSTNAHGQPTTDPPPAAAKFVATTPGFTRLVQVLGRQGQAVQGVSFRGVGFRDAAIDYMEPWGVPSGGDWALHRGGALFAEGTESMSVTGCLFQRVDGNALFLSGYNRLAAIEKNEFAWVGDSAVAAWGYTEEHDGRGGD